MGKTDIFWEKNFKLLPHKINFIAPKKSRVYNIGVKSKTTVMWRRKAIGSLIDSQLPENENS